MRRFPKSYLRSSPNIRGLERRQSLQRTAPTTTLCKEIHKAPCPLQFFLTPGGYMTFKEANEQVQSISIIPKVGCLQQESPVSETVEHFALGEEELVLGKRLCLSPLACPTFYHCCCCPLPTNEEKTDPETLHTKCLSIRQARSSQDIKLSVTMLQTQPPVPFQGSQYLPAMTSS